MSLGFSRVTATSEAALRSRRAHTSLCKKGPKPETLTSPGPGGFFLHEVSAGAGEDQRAQWNMGALGFRNFGSRV